MDPVFELADELCDVTAVEPDEAAGEEAVVVGADVDVVRIGLELVVVGLGAAFPVPSVGSAFSVTVVTGGTMFDVVESIGNGVAESWPPGNWAADEAAKRTTTARSPVDRAIARRGNGCRVSPLESLDGSSGPDA